MLASSCPICSRDGPPGDVAGLKSHRWPPHGAPDALTVGPVEMEGKITAVSVTRDLNYEWDSDEQMKLLA